MEYQYENIRDDAVSVGTTSTLLTRAHPRNEIVITNTSTAAQAITLSFGKPAVATFGVLLQPYSVYFASNTQGFNVYQGDIYAVASAALGQVSIFER